MAWCLMAPSHYLNQFWLSSIRVLCYSHVGDITVNAHESKQYNAFEYYIFKIKATFQGNNELSDYQQHDGIWRHRSGLTLAQVMACHLITPNHYLKQFDFSLMRLCGILPESSNFIMSTQAIMLFKEFDYYTFEIMATSHRGPWVN